MDSEGLILLTNDKSITDILLNPKFSHEREYLVQVEGVPNKDDLKKLEKGVIIEGRKTLPAKAKLLDAPPQLIEERVPPIRERKNIPVSWISLALIEGKNRQVRKMTASIGFPTLRLIRFRIGKVLLNGLRPGQVREIKVSSIHDII
jgi:23S rRNA pseudouridine2457 synthase